MALRRFRGSACRQSGADDPNRILVDLDMDHESKRRRFE